MGPNALPVPEMRHGKIDSTVSLTLAPQTHFAPNDYTLDLFTELNISMTKNVAIQFFWVPIEYFKTDTAIRDMRLARTQEATGVVSGDINIATNIQLVQNRKGWPDLMLGINLRTASGNGLPDARHTDAPGYFFDLSGGKDFSLKDGWLLRPHATTGFLVYQTRRDDYFQNDALLYGVGIHARNENWMIMAQFTGWYGYFRDLDNPNVMRLEARRMFENAECFTRLQFGNQSYPFTSIRAGIKIKFNRINL